MKDMGVIARDDRQLTLFYSSNTRVGTHTLSYLMGSEERIQTIDIAKVKVPGTQWVEIAKMLNCKVGDLVDKRVAKVENSDEFKTEDWIKILQNNDEVLTQPIAINGDRAKQIENPPNIMDFFSVDSAGLEKTLHIEAPTIESTTEKEDYK